MRLLKMLMLASTLASGAAEAKDSSTWLLCDDGGIALNVFETELTLFYSGHLFAGYLKDKDEGDVTLVGDTGKFKGTIKVADKKDMVSVNGSLILNTGVGPVNALLKCKRMNK